MTHPNKSKMAAAAIFNFGKISITDWIKIYAPNFMGQCITAMQRWHVTKIRNRKLIRETSSNERLEHKCVDLSDYRRYLNQIYKELKYHTINMTECSKFTWLENPRWWRPPSWISDNVNNSELDRAICEKFGGQMHHGHAEMTHDQNSKPELFYAWRHYKLRVVLMLTSL